MLDHVEQLDGLVVAPPPADDAILRLGQLALERQEAVHAVVEQSLAVDEEEPRSGLGLGQALLHHRRDELLGDAAAGRAGAQDRDGVLAERPAGDGHRGEQGPGGHGGRALDVVVERAELVAVSLQQAIRVVLGEVLPLEQHAREPPLDGLDEGVDERVIVRAGDPFVAPADIERVVEPFPVVGPGVEQDRQGGGGVDAAAGDVDRQLADRDAHAAGPLVPQAEDALAVGHHDDLDLRRGGVLEDRVDVAALGVGDEQPPGPPHDVAEALAGQAHRRACR